MRGGRFERKKRRPPFPEDKKGSDKRTFGASYQQGAAQGHSTGDKRQGRGEPCHLLQAFSRFPILS